MVICFQLRENALLCLMYGLTTFPSTEFPFILLARNIMAAAVREPRRRQEFFCIFTVDDRSVICLIYARGMYRE